MGWQDAPVVSANGGGWQDAPIVSPKPKVARSVGQELARAAGRTGRTVAQGAAGLVGLFYDPINSLVRSEITNTGRALEPFIGPNNIKAAPAIPLRELIAQGLTAVGVPDSENATERVVGDIGEALVGGGGGIAVGRKIASAGTSAVTRRVGQMLADKPLAQLLSSGAAGGAAGAARESGAGTVGQLAAGLVGGAGLPVAAAGLASGTRTALNSYTSAGIRGRAGAMLRNAAVDPDVAVSRMESARSSVPLVVPTVAESSLDPGLAGFQRSMGDVSLGSGASISQRAGENTLRRAAAIDKTLGAGRVGDLSEAADMQRRAGVAATETARRRLGDYTPSDVAGENIRSDIVEARRAARANVGRLYDKVEEGEPFQFGGRDVEEYILESRPVPDRDITQFRREALAGVRSALPKNAESITQFVRRIGGLKPRVYDPNPTMGGDGKRMGDAIGDLYSSGINPKTAPGLFRQKGRSIEAAYIAAREAGYFPEAESGRVDKGDFRQLLDALTDEAGGRKIYADEYINDNLDFKDASANRDFWDRAFGERGLDPSKMQGDDWDNLYNELKDIQPLSRSSGDLERLPTVGRPISDYQQGLLALRDQFFGSTGEDSPQVVRDVVERFMRADVTTPGSLLRQSKALYNKAASSSDGTERGFFKAAAGMLDSIAFREAGPAQRKAIKIARAARRKLGDDFETGAVGRSLAQDRYGRFVPDAASVPARLVPQAAKSAAATDQIVSVLGGKSAETVARGELRRRVEAGMGGSDIARRYEAALMRHPALSRDVEAIAETEALLKAFDASPLGRLAGDVRDPVAFVGSALLEKDGARNLSKLFAAVKGDAKATAGARRALAEHISGKTESGGGMVSRGGVSVYVPNTANLAKSVRAVNKAASLAKARGVELLTHDQRRALLVLEKELRNADFATKANRTQGASTARNLDTVPPLMKVALTAGTGKAAPFINLALAAAGRQGAVRDLVVEALVDPKLAAQLMRTPTASEARRFAGAARAAALGSGAGAAVASDKEE